MKSITIAWLIFKTNIDILWAVSLQIYRKINIPDIRFNLYFFQIFYLIKKIKLN